MIKAMFSQTLDFDPGERYAYSNFGYCLLGRVIEELTGQNYEHYMQEKVLAPIGITTMKIGASRLDGRSPNEVRYYQPGTGKSVFQNDLDQEVPWQYGGWNLEAMDSHGAWIASATDIATFAAAFDEPEHCPMLTKASLDLMYQRPSGLAGHNEDGTEKATYYSLGWQNRPVADGKANHWHSGSLSGTATIMIRRHDGKTLVALLNTRVSAATSSLGQALDKALNQAANKIVDHTPQK